MAYTALALAFMLEGLQKLVILTGAVNLMEYYVTGSDLTQAGVISGYDLTTEAALAKIYRQNASGHCCKPICGEN